MTFAKVVLAAGGTEGPSGLSIVPERAVQMVDLVRSAFGAQYARGNVRHQISFGVTRLHSSVEESLLFFLDHAQSLPATGTLALLASDRSSSSAGRWFRDAVLVRAEPVRLVGQTTIWSYSFAAGEVLKRDPAYTTPTAS